MADAPGPPDSGAPRPDGEGPQDLYALPPEEFTAARDALVRQARAAKDRPRAAALAALRRPTVSAYVVNALVRAEPGLLDQLLALGAALASAQAAGHGEQLRALSDQRRATVEALADRAADVAGRVVTAAQRAEVVSTLEAALADAPSGTAVRGGRLVRALSYAGFGEVDLHGAVAGDPVGDAVGDGDGDAGAPGSGTSAGGGGSTRSGKADSGAASREAQDRRERERSRRERRAAHQLVLEASGALDDTVRAAQRAQAAADAAERRWAAAVEGQSAAAQALTTAREALVAAQERHAEAAAEVATRERVRAEQHSAVREARQRVTSAQAEAEAARGRLAALEGDTT